LKKCNRVGVDVSPKELVVAIEASGRKEASIVLANDAEGHRKLIELATKRGASAQVVLESTGTYGLDLALALQRRLGSKTPRGVVTSRVMGPRSPASLSYAYSSRSRARLRVESSR